MIIVTQSTFYHIGEQHGCLIYLNIMLSGILNVLNLISKIIFLNNKVGAGSRSGARDDEEPYLA